MPTINDYQAEMKAYYKCLYCESEGKPSELADIQVYSHPGGFLVGDSKMWIYAECLNCKHQWSLSKLRANHECAANALSECCGAEMHGDAEGFCGGCNEFSSFECSVCEKHVEGW